VRHLLFNTDALAEAIMSHVAGVLGKPVTDPELLTRVIFEIEDSQKSVLKTDEFSQVCLAIDYLIETGRAYFDCETGDLIRA